MMNLNIFLLVIMTLAALWTVMARSLLKATMGLAITSAILTILIFRMASPLAAVFELSVCTGLITVVFVSTISMTKPLTHKEIIEASKDRLKRFWYLPVIMILAAIGLCFLKMPGDIKPALSTGTMDVRNVLWNLRQLDMFGQVIIIIAGALGVAILFKERKDES
jgi:NADH-quinone oxidoreductase subunit J